MALDLGEKYLGIAMSDPTGRIAFPHRTVVRRGKGEDIASILELAQEEEVGAIVVGLPLSLSGEAGSEAQRALDFCGRLRQATSLPVETWDERFSTVTAQQRLRDGQEHASGAFRPPGRPKAPRGRTSRTSRHRIDALAAAVILQSYLEARAKESA